MIRGGSGGGGCSLQACSEWRCIPQLSQIHRFLCAPQIKMVCAWPPHSINHCLCLCLKAVPISPLQSPPCSFSLHTFSLAVTPLLLQSPHLLADFHHSCFSPAVSLLLQGYLSLLQCQTIAGVQLQEEPELMPGRRKGKE